MTRQEHFESFMKSRYPHVPLDYRGGSDYYTDDVAFVAYQAWKEAPLHRPCEKGQITKEQLKAMKENDDPKTIVDRLNGWYGQTTEPYAVPEIQKEAAREIERLREEMQGIINALGATQRIFGKAPLSKESGKQWMENVNILEKYSRHNNKNPAEAG